ncbi:unnamed protein product [Boreogadus saida]
MLSSFGFRLLQLRVLPSLSPNEGSLSSLGDREPSPPPQSSMFSRLVNTWPGEDGALNAAGCSGSPTPADKELGSSSPTKTAGSPRGPNPVPRPPAPYTPYPLLVILPPCSVTCPRRLRDLL